ncbi:MAG: tRNA (adenine(22)-N(1))-methyltransferase TrmK [Clostridia bacterium]|nr:tRNA (adenine(22)-N(1))-methyltransferase TrmK [Clostridia bacterium]
MIKLDARLSAVASLVREGVRVADIGTDHAYLVAYLIKKGICPCGIAADLRKGPLENAKQTVIDEGLSDKVELILSDGLQNIEDNSCDDIVIAGMGGNLIAEILSKAQWIKNENINIVAQPMTHAEVLRQFFIDNGFEITKEKTATDGRHYYCIMSAHYVGTNKKHDISYIYTGQLFESSDEITYRYIEKMLTTLKKKHSALIIAGKPDEENLGRIIDEIKNNMEKTEWLL